MTATDLTTLTVREAQQGLRERLFSAAELERACRQRLEASEPSLHAYLRETPELSVAPALDAVFAGQDAPPALAGIPVALKDNLAIDGVETTAGSQILVGYRPTYDAAVVAKLRQHRATIIGKTNLDEFAMGSSTENSAFGPTHNPYDLARAPGGSSGGSAAAVASGSALFALGSDTGGSVRHPAAFCGLVGLKPTYGRLSRLGLIALTSSTDVVAILARTTEDAAIVLETLAGHDPADGTSQAVDVPAYASALNQPLQGLRAGVPQEYFASELTPPVKAEVERAIAALEAHGVKVGECSLPSTEAALWAYYIVTPAEVSANLARYDGIRYGLKGATGGSLIERYAATRGAGFGPEPKRRIVLGTFALSAGYHDAFYDKAQRVRTVIGREFAAAFGAYDFLVTPTAPGPAFKLGEKPDPLSMYQSDIYLVGASLARLPALSVPCGVVDGLPIGMQLIGPAFSESVLLRVAHQYEQARGPLPLKLAV